jgi:hypothetical protein
LSGLKRVPVVRGPSWERDAANAVNHMLKHTDPLNRTANDLSIADTINLAAGKVYEIDSVQVVGAQQAAIANLGLTVSNPPTQAEVQAVSDKVDAVLAMLRVHGLIAT